MPIGDKKFLHLEIVVNNDDDNYRRCPEFVRDARKTSTSPRRNKPWAKVGINSASFAVSKFAAKRLKAIFADSDLFKV